MQGLVIEGVTKSFDLPNGRRLEALRAVDLVVPTGTFVSLLGPSGCGKTTVLRMVSGLSQPSSGVIRFERNGSGDGSAPKIGMVFQDAVLLPWCTVLDNVTLPARIGRSRGLAQARERAAALLRSVGLQGAEELYPWQLSGGMRQRVAIARALLDDPEILLMDEPFGALDAMTRDQMGIDLEEIWMRAGKTVLFVTHSTREAAFLSDQVVVMTGSPGRVASVIDLDQPRPRGRDGLTSEATVHAEARIRRALDEGRART